ncbi:MAG: hypothetical protein M3517_01410 [Actinomycetota bacterium]|nr:hypothetical protein [Actinomycetota bacterium]
MRLPISVGERFAQALAEKDAAGLKLVLRPDVDFRAMTPGKFWEATNVDVVVDEMMLGTWFVPERQITNVLSVTTDCVGSLDRVGYRFTVKRPDGEFVIEQQAYLDTDGDTISWLRIMCSGFLPAM